MKDRIGYIKAGFTITFLSLKITVIIERKPP